MVREILKMIESWLYFSMVVLCFVGCVQLGFFAQEHFKK
jgi:hypothetical protein